MSAPEFLRHLPVYDDFGVARSGMDADKKCLAATVENDFTHAIYAELVSIFGALPDGQHVRASLRDEAFEATPIARDLNVRGLISKWECGVAPWQCISRTSVFDSGEVINGAVSQSTLFHAHLQRVVTMSTLPTAKVLLGVSEQVCVGYERHFQREEIRGDFSVVSLKPGQALVMKAEYHPVTEKIWGALHCSGEGNRLTVASIS